MLHGGLGNQLFQFAAALGVVRDSEPNRIVLLSYGNEWGSEHPDISQLLNVPIIYPHRFLRIRYPGIYVRETWKDAISAKIAKLWGAVSEIKVVSQENPYSGKSEMRARTVVLDGFFQNSEWWKESWVHVAQMIADVRPIEVKELGAQRRTAVKLRRSDYLGKGIALTNDYYREALRSLEVRDCTVTVICEDIDFIPEFAKILREFGCVVRLPEPITGNPNIDDFWHLAAAKQQVLANSSYCWWAAAVAEVTLSGTSFVYPTPWLPNSWGAGEISDMGLPGWIAQQSDFE